MANFFERIINQFRWVYWSRRFGSVKTKINADWKSINIQNPDSLYFGKNVASVNIPIFCHANHI